MGMRTPLVLVAAVVAVAGAACSGDGGTSATPTATEPRPGGEALSATPTPPRGDPAGGAITAAPDARLRDSSGRETVTPAGTRCWGNGCVDMIGPLTAPTPVVLHAGEPLTASFDAGQPTTAQFTWSASPRKQNSAVAGLVAWYPPELAGGLRAPTPLRAPDTPGDYLLTVFATWQGKGDISYAWYVRVE